MAYENIIVERGGGVGIITLNRPEVLNALSTELCNELDTAVQEFEEDPGIGVLIFTGAGDRAFSAGSEVRETARPPDDSGSESSGPWDPGYEWHLAACSKPTIGAINGLAYGAGAAMASSLDIRVGCQKTSFRFLAVSYGRVDSTWSLPMQVGWPIAKELLFTARVVDAREAYRLGLLNHLVASDQMMLKAIELAKQIAANDPRMVQRIKDLMIKGIGAGWEQKYSDEMEALANRLGTTPLAEGSDGSLQRKD